MRMSRPSMFLVLSKYGSDIECIASDYPDIYRLCKPLSESFKIKSKIKSKDNTTTTGISL